MARYGIAAMALFVSMLVQRTAAECNFDLVGDLYCPGSDVSALEAKLYRENEEFSAIVDPSTNAEASDLTEGLEYYFNGGNYMETIPKSYSFKSPVFQLYENFYGPLTGTNVPKEWVRAALQKELLEFPDGAASDKDFRTAYFTDNGNDKFVVQEEFAKKVSFYTSTKLEMNQLMEAAIQEIVGGCIFRRNRSTNNFNNGGVCVKAVEFWDQAAAHQAGNNALGGKRCANFSTCGDNPEDGVQSPSTGIPAWSNVKVLNLFQTGKYAVETGDLVSVRAIIKMITSAMLVAATQGVIRYASKTQDTSIFGSIDSKSYAEGAAFATAMLPEMYACNPTTAIMIDTKFGLDPATTTDANTLGDFLSAVQKQYVCLGITCEDIGGYYDNTEYVPDGAPCKTSYGTFYA